MSAHLATLFHIFLNQQDDNTFLSLAKDAFKFTSSLEEADGWDLDWEHNVDAMYDAVVPFLESDKTNPKLARKIMADILAVIDPVMQHYANHEEFEKAKSEYIKWNTYGYQDRHTKFHTSDIDHSKLGTGAPYTERGGNRIKRFGDNK